MRFSPFLCVSIIFTACGPGYAAPENPPDPAGLLTAQTRGAAHYEAQCASCHGADQSGGLAPTLFDDEWVYGGKDRDILRAIQDGIFDAGMPGFGEEFSSKDRRDLLAYIRSGGGLAKTPAIDNVPSVAAQVTVKTWIDGLDEPWGFVFTGPNDALVTEKKGQLRIVNDGRLLPAPVAGIPAVENGGQGGLADVAIGADFKSDGWIYLAFSDPGRGGTAMTKIVRGKIVNNEWTAQQTLFEAKPEHYVSARVHYGGRITFDGQGHLFFSIGDRGQKQQAQDVSRPNGKIHRINLDGTIPADNPFLGNPDAYPSIFAFGNRNPQGLVYNAETGVLWETEHGPKGGDELNTISAGVNYGWPEISYGRNYNGTELTPYQAKPGMAQPVSQWTPSIAVCGLDVYTGETFPEWKGRLLAGSLKNETVRLITVTNDKYVAESILIKGRGRVRDVTTGPDGAIYAALPDRIDRITPKVITE